MDEINRVFQMLICTADKMICCKSQSYMKETRMVHCHSIFDSLEVVNLENVVLHEKTDDNRLRRIANEISQQQLLKNPPLAMKITKDKHLILDGAHRISALKELGYKRAIIQEPALNLFNTLKIEAWGHVVRSGKLVGLVEASSEFSLKCNGGQKIAQIEVLGEKVIDVYTLPSEHDLETKIEKMNKLNLLYASNTLGEIKRVAPGHAQEIKTGEVYIKYEAFDYPDLMEIGKNNLILPAGITRVVMPGRLLNINIPLEILNQPSFETSQLEYMVNIWNQSIRYYEDPVFIVNL
ncbi:ParB-like nuclease domain-containing protein [Bacillus sp. OV322]|uniref:ParB N-terminal domain-containing protein n=1 Tax=Bacillus sp. OV322 TaxID=1882764 RepID=UPI0008EDC225|nr:ParB N-terminal domain-containing protein [Bacillus sp. OV322]SFC35186.1 ParB-like nuclease domain-containing protein [Bacillus sp. OV322]